MKKLVPYVLAQETDRWTEIMFRALSSRVAKRWRFVSFRGKGKREWRGIVDVLAIRKDTSIPSNPILKRGDLFEIILIQMKGGSARLPNIDEKLRLQEVGRRYNATKVVMFQWERGRSTRFCILNDQLEWKDSSSLKIFG